MRRQSAQSDVQRMMRPGLCLRVGEVLKCGSDREQVEASFLFAERVFVNEACGSHVGAPSLSKHI